MPIDLEVIDSFTPDRVQDGSIATQYAGPPRPNNKTFTINPKPVVAYVMSLPRLTFADTLWRLMETLQAMVTQGITVGGGRCHGAFWEKSLTRGIKGVVNSPLKPDYVLVIDNDSAFQPSDVTEELRIMQARPDLAAVFPVQPSRHNDQPLVYRPELDYSTEVTECSIGHFGLALIRADLFREDSEHYLPEPWLMSVPNPITGKWGEQPESDADISFWRLLTIEGGYTIAQANRVQIGHLVLNVKWCVPGDISPCGMTMQTIENYNSVGRPKFAKLDGEVYRKQMLSVLATAPPSPDAIRVDNNHVPIKVLAPTG